jgi:TPR repeat protein
MSEQVELESGGGGGEMRKSILIGGVIMALADASGGALAGPWEDGMAAYNRGDYMPAIRLFRPLAEAGNPKAQSVIGVMYRKGEGVARSSARAFMWFSLAAARGDAKAKAELHEVSRDMTPAEIAQAQEMMQTCQTSNYRQCEY